MVGGPVLFGLLCGFLLGISESAYLIASILAILGGFFAGFEHAGAREGALRGVIGGTLFGSFILIGHEIHGHEAKADLPDPAVLLIVLTAAFGALLGATSAGASAAALEAAGGDLTEGAERMGKLIVSEFITLDGVMEAPGGEPTHPHSGWVFDFMGPQQERVQARRGAGGRRPPARPGHLRVLRRRLARAPGRVRREDQLDAEVRRLLHPLGAARVENSSLLRGELAPAVEELKERHDGPILVAGSATLVHSLLEHDLVDELRLMVFPVIVGGGKRPFPESRRARRSGSPTAATSTRASPSTPTSRPEGGARRAP